MGFPGYSSGVPDGSEGRRLQTGAERQQALGHFDLPARTSRSHEGGTLVDHELFVVVNMLREETVSYRIDGIAHGRMLLTI